MAQSPRKEVSIDRTLPRAYWTWRDNPALSVPTMLSTSLTVLVEAIFGIAILGVVVLLEKTEWIREVAQAVASLDFTSLGSLLASPQFVWTASAFLVPATIVAVVVTVLASGYVYSAEFGSYWMALQGSHVGIAEVMKKFKERWRSMAWTYVVSSFVTVAPLIAASLVSVAVALLGSGLIAGLIVIASLAAGTACTLVLSALLIFSPVVVMADGISGSAAVRRSISVSRQMFGSSVIYGLVYVVFTSAVTYMASAVPGGSLPLSSLASVCVLIIVTPVLHLTKTYMYRQFWLTEPPPVEFRPSFTADLWPLLRSLWGSFRKGLGELKAFALDTRNLPYHLTSALAIVIGWVVGIFVEQNGITQILYSVGYTPGKINPLVTESLPLSLGIYIFFHNWQVSLATALSGVWFSVAPFVTLFLNGVLIGAVTGLAPNTTMLAAALLPHGIIEIPSFVIAGSAGIKLGVAFLRTTRNGDPALEEEFHSVARQTVYVVVGLALLFLVAGLIEGNLTPIIMRMAGWT